MTIGARLKEWRAFKNLNQKEASSISGVSFSTYQNYEMDISPPGAKSLQGFINAGINANWLMTGEGEMLLKDAKQVPSDLQASIDDQINEALLARLKAVLADEEIETHHLAVEIGEKTPYLRKVMEGSLPLSALTLAKLVLHKGVDANWLLRVKDESIDAEPVKFYNPLKPAYLLKGEKELLDADRLKPRHITLLTLFDTLSEQQQQAIMAITEEKERLNRLDAFMAEYKEKHKG